MTLHTDSYFAMGRTHTVCQDYAVCDQTTHNAILAVSDGCSSSPNTDFGSRFIVKSAVKVAIQGQYSPFLILSRADDARTILGLSESCLDATLLLSRIEGEQVVVNMAGDGVLYVKYKTGETVVWDIEFKDNTPAYLSYFCSCPDAYLAKHGKRKITQYTNEGVVFEQEVPVTMDQYEFDLTFATDSIDTLMLMSDGVKSFKKMVNGAWESVPLKEVLEQITAIKNSNGEFMVRRMRKFLNDFCIKNHWIHEDDVAVAAMINLGE